MALFVTVTTAGVVPFYHGGQPAESVESQTNSRSGVVLYISPEARQFDLYRAPIDKKKRLANDQLPEESYLPPEVENVKIDSEVQVDMKFKRRPWIWTSENPWNLF